MVELNNLGDTSWDWSSFEYFFRRSIRKTFKNSSNSRSYFAILYSRLRSARLSGLNALILISSSLRIGRLLLVHENNLVDIVDTVAYIPIMLAKHKLC